MKKRIRIIVEDGEVFGSVDDELKELKNGEYAVEIKDKTERRTEAQNRALHLWFRLMAEELQNKHIDKREFFKDAYFITWTPIAVKEEIWKPIQKSLFGKRKTRSLKKVREIDAIYDTINRIMIEKFNGEVETPPFPSIEQLLIDSEGSEDGGNSILIS